MIGLRDVGHVYSRGSPWARRALEGVTLTVHAGERVLVAGGNGSGKTTLAWILAGLIEPSEGQAMLGQRRLHTVGQSVAIGFQHARLQLFRPTVREDVRYGTTLDGDGVDAALVTVGLDPESFRDRRIDELSGGEQRRVALAGLLVRRPRVLVLDEPLAGLDRPTRSRLVGVLGHLAEQTGLATIVVSHDLDDADLLADRLIVLRDGRIALDGTMAEGMALAEMAI